MDTTQPHYGGKVNGGGGANLGIIAEWGELETFCRDVVTIELVPVSQREGGAMLGSVVSQTYTDGKDSDAIRWLPNQLAHNLLLLDYATSLARENFLTIVQLLGYSTPKYCDFLYLLMCRMFPFRTVKRDPEGRERSYIPGA